MSRRTPSALIATLLFALLGACSRRVTKDGAGLASSSASIATAAPHPSASAVAAVASSSAPKSVLEALGIKVTHTYVEPRGSWRLLDGLSWEGVADSLPPLPGTGSPEVPAAADAACPVGMKLVAGNFLLDAHGREDTDEVMFAQNQACTLWRTEDRGVNGLCDKFDKEKWLKIAGNLPRKAMRVCVDRYEFPDVRGEFPIVVATFSESEAMCARAGKRLCTESEWTLACEGEEGMPYPYGYERDANVCRTDILAPGPDDDTFKPRFAAHTAEGIDLAWQGRRAGESSECRSPYGIYDMIGNVDEWTTTVRKYGYKMIMKGGHWGPGRHRCRPQTRGHGAYYIRYDQGFRCCAGAGT